MLVEFRAAVAEAVTAGALTVDGTPVELWPEVPDDVTMLPCIVVGYPDAAPARETGVADRTLTLYVIARRVDAGAPESELLALTDAVWDLLGGTNGIKIQPVPTGPMERIGIEGVRHQPVSIAGIDHDAYLITLDSPTANC